MRSGRGIGGAKLSHWSDGPDPKESADRVEVRLELGPTHVWPAATPNGLAGSGRFWAEGQDDGSGGWGGDLGGGVVGLVLLGWGSGGALGSTEPN